MIDHFIHNEYFGTADHIKICDCQNKNCPIFFWGSFLNRQFHTIKYFCPKCFNESVKENLIIQQKVSGCKINIRGFRNERLPEFLLELRDFLHGKPQLRLIKIEISKIPLSKEKFYSKEQLCLQF